MTTIRLARANDGPAIGKLLADADYTDYGVDWSMVNPAGWWLLAEEADELIGVAQVIIAKPYGYIGEFAVRPESRGRRDGVGCLSKTGGDVAADLYYMALRVLQLGGSTLTFAWVDTENIGIKDMLRPLGWTAVGEFTLMVKRV